MSEENVTVQVRGNITGPDAPAPAAPAAAPSSERPSWLPEKFKSPEDMAKSYAELEKKIGGKPAPEKAPEAAPVAEKPAEGAQEAPADASEEAAQKAVTDAGLDWNGLRTEVDTNGKLSDESYEKLNKIGFPKEMVDDFIEGQKARGELIRTKLASEIGGSEQLNSLLGWMAEAASTGVLTEADLNSYNAAVTGKDPAVAMSAVKAMNARYLLENGLKPNLIKGGTAPQQDVYRSMRELVEDTKSEKYRKDPAYQKYVDAKLARSSI